MLPHPGQRAVAQPHHVARGSGAKAAEPNLQRGDVQGWCSPQLQSPGPAHTRSSRGISLGQNEEGKVEGRQASFLGSREQ